LKNKQLIHLLDELNRNIALNMPKKIPEKTRERCQRSGCYLFLYKNDILEDKI
jgi:hypothetical protein